MFAARFLARHRTAVVAAVFERSLYLQSEGAFLCLGDPVIGDGPLNAIATSGTFAGIIEASRPGQQVAIRDGVIDAASWQADTTDARYWRPAPWPAPAATGALQIALAHIDAIATTAMPGDGLAPLVVPGGGRRTASTPLARSAAPRLAKLEAWLTNEVVGNSSSDTLPPLDLIGLGPGLTPSGDDLLCGALIGLQALGMNVTSIRLASALLVEVGRATTPLSAQFLAAAAEGQGHAALHDFTIAIASANIAALPAAIAALGRIGHTSGWDALAGVVLVVRAAAAQAH